MTSVTVFPHEFVGVFSVELPPKVVKQHRVQVFLENSPTLKDLRLWIVNNLCMAD